MSTHLIYYKDGVKMMRPVRSREEYMALRNGGEQQQLVQRIRGGEEGLKHKLVQMNYSCLPNDDGTLKGSTRMSTTVGMDIDHLAPDEMPAIRERILNKKEELGLLMLEESARGGGFHLVFRRKPELDQVGNLKWASNLLGVAYDAQAKDITRVFFTTSAHELIYLDDSIFEIDLAADHRTNRTDSVGNSQEEKDQKSCSPLRKTFPTQYHGIPFETIIRKYWEVNNQGFEPTEGDRDTLTFQLACDLRHICAKNADWLDQVIPCYDGFTPEEKRAKIKNALSSEYNGFPQRLRNVLNLLAVENRTNITDSAAADDEETEYQKSCSPLRKKFPKLPQGIKDSIDAVGPDLAMPVITAVCPCIGALATGVRLDVHGHVRGLNLISYIVGEFASRKGDIDPVVDAWMSEVSALDEMYQAQEAEFRRKKRAAKNKKEQPEEPKLPVRYIPLNNTVANLAERLANVEGKHAFSFTPEADTVAQKWRSAMSDFSVLLRQSYDGSKYDREAKSAEAVNVHIKQLLWNVVMCGTPDALYRVVTNYTDGFQSRIALSQTPDNTYAPLEDKPYVLTSRQTERIQQVAHLLPLMAGAVVLPKLEAKGREWLEKIRLEAMMSDDRVKARERFRTCVTAQRMVCCLMLCKVCEQLIQKHGLNGAETQLKQHPNLWKEMLLKTQTAAMLDLYDVIADQLLDSALYFFRERIEAAYRSRDYAGVASSRMRRSKNDSIFERLDPQFSFEQAMQFCIAVKGADVTRNSVQQMLKNWRKQGLVMLTDEGRFRKVVNSQ
ncbi:DUF3987 domain-containing protein [Prevotella sp. P6B1]|uniref:DUF3987 domain-containing protein n=1 Tax=Prevotella sp. P6B1 TaxID=1410613 RepID=UPI00051C95DC|nr:DUF3987 domain-containing protein [Prevotella sp. P6B1]